MKLRVANKVAKNVKVRPARLRTILRAGRRLSWGKDFHQVFKSCDSKGGLMPCYLFTSLSDRMKAVGFVEDFVDEPTGFSWQRLTAKGKGVIVNQE
jgi:hypothetical protein